MGNERWKRIKGFSGYKISNYGRIKGPVKMLKHCIDKTTGYYVVRLSKRGKSYKRYVHRLKAQHFIPNPKNKRTVNHKNGVKSDNRLNNLEWNTYSENIQHAYDNNLRDKGEKHPWAKVTKRKLKVIKLFLKRGDFTQKRIAELFGVSPATVTLIKQGKQTLQQRK